MVLITCSENQDDEERILLDEEPQPIVSTPTRKEEEAPTQLVSATYSPHPVQEAGATTPAVVAGVDEMPAAARVVAGTVQAVEEAARAAKLAAQAGEDATRVVKEILITGWNCNIKVNAPHLIFGV